MKSFLLYFTVAALIFFAFLTFKQNREEIDEVTYYSRVLKLAPFNAFLHNNLAKAYGKEGNFEKSLYHYQQAIKHKPSFFEPYNRIGVLYLAKGDFDSAITYFQKAIQINPEREHPYHNLGKVYLTQKKEALAEKFFQKAIEIHPYSGPSHLGLALIYLHQKDTRRAKEHLFKALSSSPEAPSFYYTLGKNFLILGEIDAGIKAYKKVLKETPNDDLAYLQLGVIYYKKKAFQQAEIYWERAIELNPDNKEVIKQLRKDATE